MTNEETLKKIKDWQGAGFVHPLTCGKDDCRQHLQGREVDGAVVLVCPDCGLVQKTIPDIVLTNYVEQMHDLERTHNEPD